MNNNNSDNKTNNSLKLIVAGRQYGLTVDKADSNIFTEATKIIDEKLKLYGKSFGYKDKQDLLAMVTIELAVSLQKSDTSSSGLNEKIKNKLCFLDELLSKNI